MKAALIQMDVRWEDKRANLARAEELIEEASALGCGVAVLPEMFSTGFSMNAAAIAEDEDGPTARFLSEAAKQHSVNIIGGFSAKGKGALGRNVAHAYGRDGTLRASYAKMHPFCLAGEDKYYEAGQRTALFVLEGAPSSLFICYDLRFPEAMRAVAKEAEVVYVIANWPAERIGHWSALLKARAIENQCFVVGVNRTGADANGLSYPGASGVFGPEGEEFPAQKHGGELLICEFEPAVAREARARFPFLDDIRT